MGAERLFPEVDPAVLFRVEWDVVCHGPFAHDEPIHILEARAQHIGSLQLHSRCGWTGVRALTLLDNMSDVLALERARAHNYGLRLQIRRVAAFGLCFDIRQAYRWIPSDFTPSDALVDSMNLGRMLPMLGLTRLYSATAISVQRPRRVFSIRCRVFSVDRGFLRGRRQVRLHRLHLRVRGA